MIFRIRGKDYRGTSAVEVVRALEREENKYHHRGGPIRQYLIWSLDQLRGSVCPRELGLSDKLDDEAVALGYLLLLDENGVGEMVSESSA